MIMVEAMNEISLSEDNQGTNITCRSSENWDVLSHNNNIIKNVCISKNYNAEQEPNQERLTHLDIMIPNINIVHVAEKKKRIRGGRVPDGYSLTGGCGTVKSRGRVTNFL